MTTPFLVTDWLSRRHRRPAAFAILSLATISLSSFVSQYFWRENGLRSLQAINEPRIELIASAVRAEINRQDHLPVLLSLDADVRALLRGPGGAAQARALNEKLQKISSEADARALYVVGRNGIVLAAGQSDPAEGLIGRNLADRSYILKAIESGRSTYLGIEPTSNRVRYFLSEAITDPALLGVAVIRVEFDTLEAIWERGGERVLVTDPDGVVFLSSDPSYKYQRVGQAKTNHLRTESASPSYPEDLIKTLDMRILEQRGPNAIVRIKSADAERSFLYQALPLPEFGWTIHRLNDLGVVEADQRDGAIIGAAVSALIISLLLYLAQRQRAFLAAKRAGTELQVEVAERTRELREANTLLQAEVDERRRTEGRLRATQNELVQAGKLAALGQMSAAIAHEVNQPLAAIRTFTASTKAFVQRGDFSQTIQNLGMIDALAERMASITNHLKSFARKTELGRPEPVSVERAVEGALFLIGGQIKSAGVRTSQHIQPDLWVNGYAVQLEQVLVNLIRNALDAVGDVKRPAIEIAARTTGDLVRISISDNGPGIAGELIDRIFDPFVTSKPVGKGLGLGLSITYGIVQDFRGHLFAVNRPQGGAEFVVELPRVAPDAAFREKAPYA